MPVSYRVVIMPRASANIVEMCTRIERTSPQNAALVATRLVEAIDSLEQLPHRYPVHERRRDPAKAVRSMPVPPFIIYYRVAETKQAVEVLTVRHGARRQPKRFR
jgi:plasmid stabilization system protein ParE